MTSPQELQAAFETLLRSIACPSCGELYSDGAVQWCNGWIQGRHDLLLEINSTERDGPVRIRCERCGAKASIDYFKQTAVAVVG
jgi:uncharacterized C2H2 Zn-finger protein